MSRQQLDERRCSSWIAEGALAPDDDARFERLALELFRYQLEHNPAYRAALRRVLGIEPDGVRRWQEIPAVPTGAFKEARLACFPPEREVRAFRSSGSTVERPGELHLDTLRLYEASRCSRRSARGSVLTRARTRHRGSASASPCSPRRGADAPHSSLSYMFEIAVRDLGTPDSRFYLPTPTAGTPTG